MSYITTMAVPSGVIMAADRQITQKAAVPQTQLPEGRNDSETFILNTITRSYEPLIAMLKEYEKPLSRTVNKLFTIGDNIGVNMGQTMFTEKKVPVSLYVDYFCRAKNFDDPETAAKELCAYLHGIDGNMDTILYLAGYDKTEPDVLTPEVYRISIKNNAVNPISNYSFHYAGYSDYFLQYCEKVNRNIFEYSLQDAADICNFAITMCRTLGWYLDFNCGISDDIEMIAVTHSGIQWLKKAELRGGCKWLYRVIIMIRINQDL